MNGTLKNSGRSGGFSMIELLAVIGLFGVVAAMTAGTFVSFSNYQVVAKDADVVVSLVQKARNQTINSRNNLEYGIKFASSTVTLFQGTSYAAGSSTNFVHNLSPKVTISNIQLTGATTSLYFMPITGKPNATGTVSLRLKSAASTSKSIIIYGSGLVEVQ